MDDASPTSQGNKQKSLVICTGASRGIGRAIALAIANAARESTDDKSPPAAMTLKGALRMVLIARSSESLRETARLVDEVGVASITTSCHEMDLSDLDSLPEKFQQILEPLSSEQYESCVLINNAGSLGPLGMASTISGESSMKKLRTAIDLNLTSAMWVSSQFTKTFLASSSTASIAKKTLVRIANISSLCAIEPFPTMSIYCAGKAGRDMFHSVLAKEHSPSSKQNEKEADDEEQPKQTFKVLNYAPGPCDTQMSEDLANCADLDDGLHNFFSTSKQENKLVKCEDTANKLVHLLGLDEYESGSHVDYYDV